MAAHSYSLRSRVSSSSLSNRTPTHSPLPKPVKLSRQGSSSTPVLQLKHVIGTTTSTPSGLSCCTLTNAYAYCAGSVAVYATIDDQNLVCYRYFKARPTAVPVNQVTSYYNSPSATPTRYKNGLIARRGYEDKLRNLPRRETEDITSQTWSARERIKAVSCVSISPNGRILAVGETGYNPRVLLFSTRADAASDAPLSIITDHAVGLRSVAFNPSSTYLATLGDLNDGFLYVWQVNTKTGLVKIHSSNKCTTNVCDMAWCGNKIITVGTRHIKVWQALPDPISPTKRGSRLKREGDTSSPAPLPLQGRNCLLGSLVDATFTAVVAISETQAVVCADDGHICLLDLGQGRAELSLIEKTESSITALSCRQNPLRLVWAGGGRLLEERIINSDGAYEPLRSYDDASADTRKRSNLPRQSLLRQSLGICAPQRADTIAFGCLDSKAVSVDADGVIRVLSLNVDDQESHVVAISSHSALVKGVQALPKDAGLGEFFTWSSSGQVRFWSGSGRLLRMETVDLDDGSQFDDFAANELRVVRYSKSNNKVIVGDRYGVLQILDQDLWNVEHTIRAHSAEIHSIDLHESNSLLATSGRDRMIQIFMMKQNGAELLQTLDDHISAVNDVRFSIDGKRLLSCSADRTVVVRDRVERKVEQETILAYIPVRTITLKAAPLAMSFMPTIPTVVVISTTDRHVIKLDLVSGTTIGSFKVADRETEDTVNLNAISVGTPNAVDERHLLAGCSGIDKSVRVYDMNRGLLLGRDSGHTEGVSDIVMFSEDNNDGLRPQTKVVSTGLDSTIMIWSVNVHSLLASHQELPQGYASDSEPEKCQDMNILASLPPLRKILSRMDMAAFARQSSPTREVSPNGLRRKNSRLALATSIEETDETPVSDPRAVKVREGPMDIEDKSPSPPTQIVGRPKKQRSQSDMYRSIEPKASSSQELTYPSAAFGLAPATLRHSTRANNGRLRRPPSVPNDLRAQAAAQAKRLSVSVTSNTTEFGSIGLATEQTCRILKSYQKRLQLCKDDLDLDDIEADLEATLSLIRVKRSTINGLSAHQLKEAKKYAEDEVNGLSAILARTTVS